MTERWRYDEVKKIEGVEIRKFHASVFADVTVHSPFNMAGSLGFRPLVTYISQNQIEMTAPVLQEKVGDQSWTVSFVMPEGAQLSDLPLPKNSDVKLRQVPEHFAAALSFSGASSWKTIEQKDLAAVGASAQSAWSQVNDATPRPPRAAGVKVNDEGNGGEALVNFLAEKKLI